MDMELPRLTLMICNRIRQWRGRVGVEVAKGEIGEARGREVAAAAERQMGAAPHRGKRERERRHREGWIQGGAAREGT